MYALDKALHGMAIGLARPLSKLLPDRVPVTFVGPDATRELGEAIVALGVRKLLVVTDAGLVALGIVERITRILVETGLATAVFDGVEPDPIYPQVEAGLALLEGEGCDAVLAIGGGSPMDAAKVIAAAATNGGDPRKLEGRFRVRRAPLPLFAIPTTAGTGSEVTVAAVVSEPDTHEKKFFVDPKLLPSMAALDPTLMTGLPPQITAATGMDALTHAVESYLALTATPQTEHYATAAIRLIFAHLPTAWADGANLPARKAMALASWYAGLAFTRTSVGYVHAIAHSFGAKYGTPHGLANAIALPHVLDFSCTAATPRLARLGEVLGLEGATEGARAGAFIEAVRGLMTKVDIPPSLEALRRDDIPALARQARREARANYPVPRYMSQADCEDLIGRMVG